MPRPHRRRFLVAAAAAGSPLPVAALAPFAAVTKSGSKGGAASMAPGASAFEALVGDTFEARNLSTNVRQTVSLRSVDALPGAAKSERGFVLTFDAGPDAVQGTYALAHAALPPFAALLVPDAGDAALVAVFNRR